jgi:hypothetical protein
VKKLYFIILLFPILSQAQSPVTHSAGAGSEIPAFACKACIGTDWFYAENITKADDSVTTAGLNANGNCFQSTCYFTRYLYAHHFNFDIPSDATIDSVFVDVLRAAKNPNAILDSIVQLEKGDSMVGLNLHSTHFWPTTLQYESYGHDNPLWGTTWLPADLNDSISGVVIKIVNKNFSEQEAYVDHIRMTVYFSTSTGTSSVTSSPSEIEWINSPGEIEMKFNSASSVKYELKIYNTIGQEVMSFHHRQTEIGENRFQFSTGNLVDGIYFLAINIGSNLFTRKFSVVNH